MPTWEQSPWEDKERLTLLRPSQQQNEIPFYQRLSWKTNEIIVPTEHGRGVSDRSMGDPEVATVKALHASQVMTSHGCVHYALSLSSLCTAAPPQYLFPVPHVGNGWTLRWGLSDSLHTVLLGGQSTSPTLMKGGKADVMETVTAWCGEPHSAAHTQGPLWKKQSRAEHMRSNPVPLWKKIPKL